MNGEAIPAQSRAAFARAGWTPDPQRPLFRRETATHSWTALRQGGRWLVRLWAIGFEGREMPGTHRTATDVLAGTRRRETAAAGHKGRPAV